jgi:hypothetical protein
MPTYNYSDVRAKIKETATIYWFNKDGNLLLTGLSKSKTKKIIKKEKYEGNLYRLSLSFHSGEKKFQGGPLAVKCVLFEKKENKVSKVTSKKNGTIWIEKKYLESSGFSKKMLDIIIDRLKGKLEFSFGIYTFRSIL